jgi:protein ImuB
MKSFTPDRLACVDLPAFPLQLLLQRHREWAGHPAAVVAEDKPQGLLLWVNEKARRQGVLPGLRYAAALSLASDLRAGVIAENEIKKAVEHLVYIFMRFTPEVEASNEELGIFWLNGAGLGRLYSSPNQWARAIQKDLRDRGFTANVAVGFTRFGPYAVAKSKPGVTVFCDPAEERDRARAVPLSRLNIDPEFRDALSKLGIATVGALLSLPPGGLRERFGKAAHRLHRLAAGDLWAPLEPRAPEEPVRQEFLLDDPENDATRLLFLIKQMLHPLLATLAERHQALAALRFSLLIDHGDWLRESLRPAAPTLDAAQILDLVRLRLESLQLAAGVIEIELGAETAAASSEQLCLFEKSLLSGMQGPARDLDAVNRALARLRAEFGEESVVCARLADGHLPEAKFTWEPMSRLRRPEAKAVEKKTLVRRILTKPEPLFAGPFHSHEDPWLLGSRHDAVARLIGPYVFSGGWWNRAIEREYYYVETRRGDLLWLYYDRVRRKWFCQGGIE